MSAIHTELLLRLAQAQALIDYQTPNYVSRFEHVS